MYAGSLASRLPRWAVIKDARRRHRRRLRRRAIVLAVLAAVAAAVLTQRSVAGSNRSAMAAAGMQTAAVGGHVLQAQAAGDRIWVLTCVSMCGAADRGLDREQLVEVDAASGAVRRRLTAMANLSAFTIAGGGLWVAHFLNGQVARLNPVTGRVTASLQLRLPKPVAGHDRRFFFMPVNLSSAGGYVWASTARGWLAEIDVHTAKLVRMVSTPSEDNATTTDRYGTWVAEDLDGFAVLAPGAKRLRIHGVMQAGLPVDVYDMIGSGGQLWALASPDSTASVTFVLRIDPRTGRVIRRVSVPTSNPGSAVTGGALYLADLPRGRLYRVSGNGVLTTISTPRHRAWLAAAADGALWAATGAAPGQKHGRLLRIALPHG